MFRIFIDDLLNSNVDGVAEDVFKYFFALLSMRRFCVWLHGAGNLDMAVVRLLVLIV